jgi:hypothetical protein
MYALKWVSSITILALAYTGMCASFAAPLTLSAPTRSLLVLYDPVREPNKPSQIIDAVSRQLISAELALEIGTPKRAKFMLTAKMPARVAAVLSPYSADALLERYIVLNYDDTVSLSAVHRATEIAIDKARASRFAPVGVHNT